MLRKLTIIWFAVVKSSIGLLIGNGLNPYFNGLPAYNYAYDLMVAEPSNNINSYVQPAILKNDITTPPYMCPKHKTYNKELNQLYLNKILSNPYLRTFLENTAKLYQNEKKEDKTPAVVNNYFIVPPQFLTSSKDKVDQPCSHEQKTDSEESDECNVCDDKCKNNKTKVKRKKKPTLNLLRTNRKKGDGTKTIMNRINIQKKKRYKSTFDNVDSKKLDKNKKHKNDKNCTENIQGNEKIVGKTIKITPKTTPKKPEDEKKFKADIFGTPKLGFNYDSMNNKLRFFDPKDDMIVKDLSEKYPSIPIKLLQHMLAYVKHQFGTKNNTNDLLNYYNGFPFGVYPFWPSPIIYNKKKTQSRKNRVSSNSIIQKPKTIKPINSNSLKVQQKDARVTNSTISSFNKSLDTKSDITNKNFFSSTTLENDKNITKSNTTIQKNFDDLKMHDIPSENSSRNSNEFNDHFGFFDFPNLGDEDVVPIMSNNEVLDDYYPDFTDENTAYIENVLDDDKYRYSYTDIKERKDLEEDDDLSNNKKQVLKRSHESNNDPRKHDNKQHVTKLLITLKNDGKRHKMRILQPKKISKVTSSDDIPNTKAKQPLFLPDFKTKQVKTKSSSFEDEQICNQKQVSEKGIEHSEEYSSNESSDQENIQTVNEILRVKVPSARKSKNDVVETLSAGSKVIKYGQVPEKEEKQNDSIHEKTAIKNKKEPTIVYAQSLGPVWPF